MPSSSTTCPEPQRTRTQARRGRLGGGRAPGSLQHSRGFTLVSVVFILVVLTALGAALAQVSVRQQLGSASEVESARAMQAARAGLEWAAFQALSSASPPACFGATSFVAAGLGSYTVTVSCTRTSGSDGSTAMVFYQLLATACNVPTAGNCPNTAAAPDRSYVERQLAWTVQR